MHRALHRFAPSLLFIAVAGCGPRPSDAPSPAAAPEAPTTETARRTARGDAADAKSPLVSMDAPDAADRPTTGADATPVGEWLLQESDPPRAVWGVHGSEGMLVLACDRAAGQLVLERQAIGVPDDVRVVTLDADGVRMDYPAERREDALAPVLVTRVALDAPILDRLLMAQRVVFTAGTDTIATTAPGPSLRAVVDACRRGPAT